MCIKPEEMPATSNVPMLYDQTEYKLFIILKDRVCSTLEIEVVSKICNINYLEAKKRLMKRENYIAEGSAYWIRDIRKELLSHDVNYKIEPQFPY